MAATTGELLVTVHAGSNLQVGKGSMGLQAAPALLPFRWHASHLSNDPPAIKAFRTRSSGVNKTRSVCCH